MSILKFSNLANHNKKTIKQFNRVNEYLEKNLKDKYLWHKSYFADMNTLMRVCSKSFGFFKITPKELISPKFKGSEQEKERTARKKKESSYPRFTTSSFNRHLEQFNLSLYEGIEFKGLFKPVWLKCPIHGAFKVSNPLVLLNEKSTPCAACRGSKGLLTNEEYITRAKLIHGEKYLYTKVDYKGVRNKITVTCPFHGDWDVTPYDHLYRQIGCPKCNIEGFPKFDNGVLYFLEVAAGKGYKIGITSSEVREHYSRQDLKNIKVLKTWRFQSSQLLEYVEKEIIQKFKQHTYDSTLLLNTTKNEGMFNKNILQEIEQLLEKYSDYWR